MSKPKVLKTTRSEAEVMQQVLEAAAMLGLDLSRQNTGAGVNPAGKTIRFGRPGNSDLSGVLPDGRAVMVELKHENFDPDKLRGAKKDHFNRQLARLQKTNSLGGVGFFCDNAEVFLRVMQIVLRGGRVDESGYSNLIVYDPDIEATDARPQ